jgi:RHS repeat-associated protein
MLASGSFTTCGGYFYDGGGPNGDYMISQHSVVTLYPATPGAKLSVNFNSFHTTANADFLYVYNGNDTSAPRIATLTGPSGFGIIRSSATDGSLTFKFISDNIDTYADEAGWAATISCNIGPYKLPYSIPGNAIGSNSSQLPTNEPIQLGTGTYSYRHTDINIPVINGTLNFTRFYNSLNGDLVGQLGNGWSHTYNYYLDNRQDTAWDIHYPDGHLATFIPMNSLGQSFPIYIGTTDSLQKNNDGSYTLTTKEKLKYDFNSAGKLDSIVDLNDNITTLYYTGTSLDSVVAPGGRSLKITYTGNQITSVKDPLNRICSYTYDANGNLATVKDASNNTASFTYDTAHRMLTAVNPLGNIIAANTYDDSGRVVMQKDAYNQVTSIVYNFPNFGDATVTNPDNSQWIAHHDIYIRKTSIKDELGFTKTFSYDSSSNENAFTNEDNKTETRLFDNYGNELSDTLPGGKITNITYNLFNSPVLITDPKGNQKHFYYAGTNNNLDSIRYPDNSLQAFYYNNMGQVIQSVDGNGNSTTYTYSTTGDLLSITTPAGVRHFGYDAAGHRISSTDENGYTTTYDYDNNDNIIKITDPLGRTIQNTYDANNQLVSVKDKKGFITAYTYDKKGRRISSTNPKGGVTTYAYDVRDNLISITDPNSKVITYTYDEKGRKTSMTNALGTTQYQYDGVGNLIQIKDPTNKTIQYTYTSTNKKLSHQDGVGNKTNYSYDLNDNLTSVTDPLNRITSYTYDVMNRLISVKDAANKTTSITYDKNGNRKSLVDLNGHTQTYSYDAVNRLTNYQDAAGNNYTYSYDSTGNNVSLTKPTGTIAKVYDASNRVVTVNNSSGDNYHFIYDNNDNITSMSNNVGTTNMVYDSLNDLTQYQDPYSKTVSFTYNKAGNKTSIIYPGNKIVSYTYDAANNLKTVTDWRSHTFTYSYDAAGRITKLLYPNASHCDYGYDNAGRLISKISSLSNDTIISGSTFTLDAIGNRVAEQRKGQIPSGLSSSSRAYSYGNDDRMLTDSIWNFVNDNSGNRISETNGVKTASYTFSVDNLLNSWIDTTGATTNYLYDALGHRISKVAGANTDKYVLDISSGLSQILQIADATGVVQSNYVYGLGLLESIDASGNPLYYHFDAQHNTTTITDQTGVIKDTYTYDPFGSLLNHSGISTQPFTFLGEYGVEQESSTLYYARARYYDAANGRFLSKDDYSFDLSSPQTINRYVYVINNPLIRFDYSGLYENQDNNVANSSIQSLLNYLFYNPDAVGIGGISSDILDHILNGVPTIQFPPILNGFSQITNGVFNTYDVTKAVSDFAANLYFNNPISGSEWAYTLKTIVIAGGATIAGAAVGTSILPAIAIGVGAYVLDKTIDYYWQKYNWSNSLNKLW